MPVVRIRGMPFFAKKSDVVEFFSGINILNKEKGVHFIQRHPVKPSGEAYVELVDEKEEDLALKKHKEYMFNRYIEGNPNIHYVLVFSSTQEELNRYLGDKPKPGIVNDAVIRLRGLPWDISKMELSDIFWDVEIVPNGLALIMDHTGYCTGEGYMRIAPSRVNIDRALAKDAMRIGRRPLEVTQTTIDEADHHIKFQVDRNRMLKRPMGQFGYPGSYGYPCDPYSGSYPPIPRTERDRSPIRTPRKSTGYCIYMRGLPFESKLKDVQDFFYPIRVLDVRFSKGDAFAEFLSYEDVEEAMKRDRNKIGHRYIELFMRCEDGPDSSARDRREPYKKDDSFDLGRDSERKCAPAPVPPPMSYYDSERY